MSYVNSSQIPTATAERERNLLLSGFSYLEIAAITGAKVKTISERNRLVYKIDIWKAFERRIKTNGIANRLTIGDDFGYWFSGFFDGEGSIITFTRPCTGRSIYSEFRLGVRIQIRDDDTQAIVRIQDNLKVGRVSFHPRHGAGNPTVAWTCERIQDLGEVIIPLFDRYPLYTKKAKEYAIWKPVVLQRYIDTLGGYSNRHSIPEDHREAFYGAIEAISKIRDYRAGHK